MNCSSCGHELKGGKETWTFHIPLEPPSQNTVAGNHGSTRWRYAKLRDEFVAWMQQGKANEGIPTATKRRRVLITRQYGSRGKRRDRGNLIGGCKPLLDAMTIAGLITDDKEEGVDDHYGQERAKTAGAVITVQELG